MTITKAIKNLDITFSPLLFFDILFVVLTLIYLSQLGLVASTQYITLIVVGTILLVFAFLLFKDKDFITQFFPVNKSLDKDVLVRFLGLSIPLLFFILSFVFALNLYNPMLIAPLGSLSKLGSPETFEVIKASASSSVSGFIVTQGASRIEEIVLGFELIIAGALATYLFVAIYEGIAKTILNKKTRNNILLVGGFLLSIFFFVLLHTFNNTYINNPKLFFYAGVFRLIMNILILKFLKLGITFGIAFHEMWNLLALGKSSIFSFLTSTAGILLILFNLLLLLFLIIRFDKVVKEFKKIITLKSSF